MSLQTTSAFGEKLESKPNIINVFANTNPPKATTAVNNGGSVSLAWAKPEAGTPYAYINEMFTATAFPPTGWQVLDANKDGNTWKRYTLSGDGIAGVYSRSTTVTQGVQTDDYLISPVVNPPTIYTELTFKSPYGTPGKPDNLKIYAVKTKVNTALTADQVKAGTLIFDGPIYESGQEFYKVDLSTVIDGNPFRLAFYSNNFDRNMASLDNIRLSTPGFFVENEEKIANTDENIVLNHVRPDSNELMNDASTKPAWPQITTGPSNAITAYEVLRDGNTLTTLTSSDMVYVDNTISSPGNYCYEIVAVYDGVNKSTPSTSACVQVDTVLSTVDMKKFGNVAAFPNPVVDKVKVKFAQSFSGKADVEIYSADGKKVSQVSLTERELADQGTDMSKLSSGMYVLIVKTNGKSYSTKVIKK